MSIKYKIKKVKDFVEHGPPQFEPLMCKEYLKSNSYYMLTFLKLNDDKTETDGQVRVELNENRIAIKKVRRLSDSAMFSAGTSINVKNKKNEFFIIEFNDDLVHCLLLDVDLLITITLEVNSLEERSSDFEIVTDNIDTEEDEEEKEREAEWVKV